MGANPRPIIAAPAIGSAVEANLLTPAQRQVLLRTAGSAGLAGGAAAGGATPREIAESALTGAAFPVGAREGNPDVPMDIAAREATTLGVNRAQTVPDFQREIAAREASVNSLPSPRGVRVRDQLRGVQPAEISTTPTRPPAMEQVPESLGVVGPTKPVVPVEEGAKLNRWQHRDFGLVTESASQSGVTRGKVRVLAEDGSEHVIQRPNMRGEGNQIAVPVRQKPIDARAEDTAECPLSLKHRQRLQFNPHNPRRKRLFPSQPPRLLRVEYLYLQRLKANLLSLRCAPLSR